MSGSADRSSLAGVTRTVGNRVRTVGQCRISSGNNADVSFVPSWLQASPPDLVNAIVGLAADRGLGASRFTLRNFLREDGVDRRRAEQYVRLAADRVSAPDPRKALEQFYRHHHEYVERRLAGGVRTEPFNAQSPTCPETFISPAGEADGAEDLTYLGRVEELRPMALLSEEPGASVRALLDRVARGRRDGTPDRAAEDDAGDLLLRWQQNLDNRPMAAFAWGDLDEPLSRLDPGWESAVRDRLGLWSLDPARRDPGPGIEIVVFRYPARLVPTGAGNRRLLRRPTPFDVELDEAFCTSPPVGVGHRMSLQLDDLLCREVIHPAVTFKAEHVWAVGTVRDSNPGSLEELRWAHLLKVDPLSDEGFRRRVAAVDEDLL
jgi:hypothetical protein